MKDCLIDEWHFCFKNEQVIGELGFLVGLQQEGLKNDKLCEQSLANIIHSAEAFSLFIEDSMDINDVAQCSIFIRLGDTILTLLKNYWISYQ